LRTYVRLNAHWLLDCVKPREFNQCKYDLRQHLNKSGCYKDVIYANRDNIHKKDVVWMERQVGAGFENDAPDLPSEGNVNQEVG